MKQLKEVLDEIQARANAASEVLFHLGAEAAFAIVLAALRDRKRFNDWVNDAGGRHFSSVDLGQAIKYLEHVIKEETTDA